MFCLSDSLIRIIEFILVILQPSSKPIKASLLRRRLRILSHCIICLHYKFISLNNITLNLSILSAFLSFWKMCQISMAIFEKKYLYSSVDILC